MLKLQKFIKENPNNFKELLAEKPYSIKIQEDPTHLLFKYNQISSDFSIPLVQEARGIILEKGSFLVVGRGFNKFFNEGEALAAKIDWDSAFCTDKKDGGIIKIWYNNFKACWQISTNGTINSKDAGLQDNIFHIENYYDLVMYTLDRMNIGFGQITSMMEKDFSYVFEITSPANVVVIHYDDFVLTHLATIHNKTGNEIEQIIGLPKPIVYPLTTLDECYEAVKNLNPNKRVDFEGFVIKDKFNNRIKIKDSLYLHAHYLKGEGGITDKKVLTIIRAKEIQEILAYFPEYKSIFDEMEIKYKNLLLQLTKDLADAVYKMATNDRKVFASWATKQIMPSILFAFYDDKIKNANEGLEGLPSEKLLRYLK